MNTQKSELETTSINFEINQQNAKILGNFLLSYSNIKMKKHLKGIPK